MPLILHDQLSAVKTYNEQKKSGVLTKNFNVPDNLLLIGCHNRIADSFFEDQMKEYNCKDYKCMRLGIHPWSNTLRLKPYIEYLKRCTSKDYVIFLDTDDAFISASPDKILQVFLDEFDCDLLFNATKWPRGYHNNSKESQHSKAWANKTHKGWYLNAGAYIGRKDFIINVFEEVLKYVTDHDLPAKKWYHYETFMPKGQELNIVKNIAENFPKGCGSDQAILRHIEKQFYPNLMLDTQKKIFARIGARLGYEPTQRNVFIDCGAHRGQSIRKFLTTRQYKENPFKIWSFEPNFELIKEFAHRARKMKNIRIIPQAVWFEDKEMNFYLDRNDGDGSSLLKEKKHPSGFKENDLDNPLKAYAFDFSAWVLNNFSPDDYIIVKMDIEGAEYGVLAKMIADGALDYVNELYIEWHHEKVNIPKEVHDALVEKIKSMSIVLRGEFLKGAEHLKYR